MTWIKNKLPCMRYEREFILSECAVVNPAAAPGLPAA